MAHKTIRWVRRAAVLAVAAAVIRGLLTHEKGTPRSGSGTVPVIGGDTWPPVPTNPDRKD